MFGWPWNALIVLGVLACVNAAFVWATWRFERAQVPPPLDPEVLAERAFADDVERHLRES